MEIFWKLFEAIVFACLLLHMFRHLGDLLTIKILKGIIKNLYCQNRDILGSCENYLKLLHALYNCASNIRAWGGNSYLKLISLDLFKEARSSGARDASKLTFPSVRWEVFISSYSSGWKTWCWHHFSDQRQDSSTRDLIFNVPQIISFLSMSSRL